MKKIYVGVTFAGDLTPVRMAKIAAMLQQHNLEQLVNNVLNGITETFQLGMQDGVQVHYPFDQISNQIKIHIP